VLVIVLMLASYALAVSYRGSLVGLLLFAYGPVVQFAPAVYATLFVRRTSGLAVLGGLLAGIAVNLLFVVRPELRPWALHAGCYGLSANVLVLVLLSLARSGTVDPAQERYLRVAAGHEEDDS
jgi:SSS family solute:Na+ symporter